MNSFRSIWLRLRSISQRRAVKQEIDDELRFHIEQRTVENITAGMSPEEAARMARKRFGNMQSVREECREAHGASFGETAWQDIRFGVRMLRKNPGFAAVAVLTLALGTGANTAIFTLIDAVMLKMLPVKNPQELVELGRNSTPSFSYPLFERLRDGNQTFSGLLVVSRSPLRLTGDAEAETVQGQYISGNFFTLLGVNAWTGRMITPADDRISDGGGSTVAVISYGLWQQRFGGDPSIVGKQLTVEEKPFTIIGVTPPEFFGVQPGTAPGFWIPIATEPALRPKSWLRKYEFNWLTVMGRLKPGVSPEQARANLDVIFKQVLADQASLFPKQQFVSQSISVEPASNGLSRLRRQFSKPLLVLMAMAGLVLLIACANIANLLLARGAARRREVAVRLALGASRWRLVRQFLTESFLLSLLGGLAGLVLAFWASGLLVSYVSSGATPVVLHLRPDSHVLSFTLITSLLAGVLFGLAPAIRATRVDVGPALKENSRRGDARPGVTLGKLLVVSQVAVSLILVMGAGLFVRSLLNLKTLDAGFNRENVLLADLNPGKAGYSSVQRGPFYQAVLERVRQIPGVRSASLSWFTPIQASSVELPASVPGYTSRAGEDADVYVNNVSPGYFETLGTPLLLGVISASRTL